MLPTLFADKNVSFWFPEQASNFAKDIDFLYDVILWISIAFFIPIVAAMVYFVIKYRERPGYKGSPEALHNTTIEVLWSVGPTLLLALYFGWVWWVIWICSVHRHPEQKTSK